MRTAYVAFAGLLLLTVVYQFVTAGLIIFDGESTDAHSAGAGIAHIWPVLMLIVAAVGKLGRDMILLALALLVLVVVQSGLPDADGAVAAFHPLVALVIAFVAHTALHKARARPLAAAAA